MHFSGNLPMTVSGVALWLKELMACAATEAFPSLATYNDNAFICKITTWQPRGVPYYKESMR